MKIVNDDYPLRVRPIYWMYYLLGGIYVSEEFSTRVKWSWFALNFLNVMWIILGGIGFFMTAESYSWMDVIIGCSYSAGPVYCLFIVPSITCYFYRDIANLLRFIDHAASKNGGTLTSKSNVQNEYGNRSFEKTYRWCIVILLSSFTASMITPALTLTFRTDAVQSSRGLEHHLMGVPYADRISSLWLFWGIYLVELLLFSIFAVTVCSESLFVITVTYELQRIVAIYCENMRTVGETFVSQFHVGRDNTKICHQFDIKLSSFIRGHQNITRSIKLIRPYFQIFSSCSFPAVFLFSASQMFIFLLTNFDFPLKLRIFTHTVSSQFIFYLHCKFGTMLDNMKEDIVQEVYNLPWYYLPPSQRKKFYIFLNGVQRPIVFNALRIFPLNMRLFIGIPRLAYSIVNALVICIRRVH